MALSPDSSVDVQDVDGKETAGGIPSGNHVGILDDIIGFLYCYMAKRLRSRTYLTGLALLFSAHEQYSCPCGQLCAVGAVGMPHSR